MGREVKNFWRCDPHLMLKGCVDLTPEEVGVYIILLNVMYKDWEPLPYGTTGERQAVARRVLNAVPQKVNPIIRRLIERKRFLVVEAGGKTWLTDHRFEEECVTYKGLDWSPCRAAVLGEKPAEVGTKSQQSPDKVPTKYPTSFEKNEQNQGVISTEENKNRIKKEKEKKFGRRGAKKAPAEPSLLPRWMGNPAVREACREAHGEGWTRSYLDSAQPRDGGVQAGTWYAYDVLFASPALAGLQIFAPP